MIISLVVWILIGLITGLAVYKVFKLSNKYILFFDILAGILGSFLTIYVIYFYGSPFISGLNIFLLLAGVYGSIIFLMGERLIFYRE
ncbi:hypothetical protein COV24_04540 [candidate division WWE3 bacterium CG10_big_fil_rev_8_21_14_0_10_32_10]|uniref:GlsB/YeaQ/YmgE family stress response membrane protein n=1 Tax=candidate division WWE3 bacterium CG10_big_fil_rev_8_21_14_0_10_32_10 TaxID=1975090 RepID=A0A2H0R9A7_UNCKA|nr:MAG: hypothetical protein COV24_04540 [candidate division WWE3 bacterium CG10_big_fil_rev_8_21_14_0_10_32_10]